MRLCVCGGGGDRRECKEDGGGGGVVEENVRSKRGGGVYIWGSIQRENLSKDPVFASLTPKYMFGDIRFFTFSDIRPVCLQDRGKVSENDC